MVGLVDDQIVNTRKAFSAELKGEFGVGLQKRGRDFGELASFVVEDIQVAGRLHDDLKEKVLHVHRQVMHLVEWSNGITTTLNDVEGRVDNLEQWGEELAQIL